MDTKNQQTTKQARVFFIRLIILIVAITITFVILNFVLYRNNEFFYQQLILLIIYLAVTLYLFIRLFMIFRIFIRNEALLEESNKHMQELKLFTNNLIKQRKEIQRMLNETTELSNKLLEQNLKLHTAQEEISQEKEKFATLFQASQLIASSWDLEQVLPKILELANKLVNFKTGRILIPENNYLVVSYAYGYDINKHGKMKINIGEGICGLAALNREIIIVEDVLNDPRYIKEIEETRAEIDIPLKYQGELLGILDIQDNKPFAWLDYPEDIFDILVLFGNYTAMVIHNSSIYTELKNSYVNIIKVLAKAIDAKDNYTHGHCERVKELSLQIGRRLELDPKDLEELEFAAFLHDIGKIALPESILYKPGLLTPVEFDVIKSHPSIGADMIGDIPFLQRTKRIIEQHHERIDGTGYPKGIKGNQMDFLAKIISVADAIDAMMTKRPYRAAQNAIYVLNELERCKGTQFDPLVTEVAKTMILEDLEKINLA
ncbi:MAG: HD domain-containing protein [Clostridia bacterium]|nr:HD domain-containing protein [Clostridia bacterium]